MGVKTLLLGFTLAICCVAVKSDMECKLFNFKQDNEVTKFVGQLVNRCPVLGTGDKEYCCYNFQFEAHCCEVSEFAVNVGIMLMILIVVLMLVSSLISFICCICCPCCCWYKRRRGSVLSSQATSHRIVTQTQHTEYQPIVKSHIPPGAFQVLPTSTTEFKYSRSHS